MNSGEKIASLRKAKGMTQAELGTELNVTFQAVSKWERGESYPDFETMSRLAKLFGVPLTYFEDNDTSASPTQEATETPAQEVAPDSAQGESATSAPTTTQAQASEPEPAPKVMLGVCKECGKVVYDGEEMTTSPAIICKACHARKVREEKLAKEAEEKKKIAAARAVRQAMDSKRNRGLIWSAFIIGIIAIIGIVVCVKDPDPYMFLGLGIIVLFGYPFVAQLFWGGLVVEIVCFGGKVIGTPGIIFSFDWDGIKFFVAMKILFALLRFFVWLVTFLASVAFAMLVSPISFITELVRLNKGIDPAERF